MQMPQEFIAPMMQGQVALFWGRGEEVEYVVKMTTPRR